MVQKRRLKILEIIKKQNIETQEELLACLGDAGFAVTQATISRDIRELQLYKAQGRYQSPGGEKNVSALHKNIFKQSVIGLDIAQNLVVMKTLPGTASGACKVLDDMEDPSVVGTLAGDDTAFIALRDECAAAALLGALKTLLGE